LDSHARVPKQCPMPMSAPLVTGLGYPPRYKQFSLTT